MNIDPNCVLIEASNDADARFLASWLLRAAEAESLWSEVLKDKTFADETLELHACVIPNFETAALDLLWAIQSQDFVMARRLYTDDRLMGAWEIEFAMMVRLGFFEFVDRSYRMMVPEVLTLERVKQVAFDLMKTMGDVEGDVYGVEVIQPEVLLTTLPASDAEVQRSRLIALRNFKYERNSTGQSQ
jgi:hypothetical protein